MYVYKFKYKCDAFVEIIEKSNIQLLKIERKKGVYSDTKANDLLYPDKAYSFSIKQNDFFYAEKYKEIVAYLPSEFHWEWLDDQTKYNLQGVIGLHDLYDALCSGNYGSLEEGGKPGVGRFYFTDDNVPYINFNANM